MCILKLIYTDIECVVRLKDIIFDNFEEAKNKLESVYNDGLLTFEEFSYPPIELGISKEYECFYSSHQGRQGRGEGARGELIGGLWIN